MDLFFFLDAKLVRKELALFQIIQVCLVAVSCCDPTGYTSSLVLLQKKR